METFKKSSKGGTFFSILFMLFSIVGQAQANGKFLNEKPKDLIISAYIVGGVMLVGILTFAIAKIAAKYSKEEDGNERKISRTLSHRHRHHHRVVKKSS